MDSIVEGLMTQLMSGDNLSLMSSKVGADDKSVKSALELALPLLIGTVSQKASQPDGASTILAGVSGMGADNPVDRISGYLNAPETFQGPDLLNSIIGSQLKPIEQYISKSTGLPPAVVGQLLAMVLPLVIGSLSKNTKQEMGPTDLSALLGEQSKMAMATSPDAAAIMNELLSSQKGSGGLMGLIKRLFT